MAHYVPKHLTARKRRRRTGWGWLIVLLPALICLVACRAFTTRGPDPTPVAAVSPVGLSLPSPEGTETPAPTVTPAPTPTPTPAPTPTPTATPEPEEVKPLFLFLPEVPLEPDLQEAMQAACDEYNVPFALALAVG